MECKESGKEQQPDEEQRQHHEQSIKAALDCPCVKDLKDGPCGESFVLAFTCFHRSTADPKGCDCLQENLAFARCLERHPEAYESLKSTRESGGLQKAQRLAAMSSV